MEGTVHLVVAGEVTTSVELCGIGVDGGAAVVRVGGWVMVLVTMEDDDEMVGGTVVKPALKGLAAGVLMLGWVEVMGVDLVVVVVRGRSSVMVTLLQVLQHIRWKSGRAQCRFRASRRQKVERSPLQRRPVK